MARGFDYSQFEELYRNTVSIQQEFHTFLSNFLLQEGLRAIRAVRPLTPVDTGNLRRNWALSDVRVLADRVEVDLVNPVEYASFMEHGFTYQKDGKERRFPGFHMAEISIARIQQNMPRRFNTVFASWLRAKGWG